MNALLKVSWVALIAAVVFGSACSGSSSGLDGGTDSGTVDSGLADAGGVDSGVADAGVPDSGIVDAGPVRDSGIPDAGPCGPLTTTLTRCAANPLFDSWRPGLDGGFGWTSADPTVMFDSDDGLWKMWFSSLFTLACDAEVTNSDLTHIDIMYAESADGLSWSVQPDPALTSHVNIGDWDYSTVETPTVIKVASNPPDRRYMLMYAGANSEKYPDGGFILPRIAGSFAPWQIGLAFSADGHHFTRLPAAQTPYASASLPGGNRDGLVFYAGYAFPTFPSVVYGSVADPEVVLIGDTYTLFFSSAGTDETGVVFQSGGEIAYGISTATSFDGISWTANAANPVIIGAGQPTVLPTDAGFTMYFSLDAPQDLATAQIPSLVFPTLGFYRGTSSDGVAWRTPGSRELAWDETVPYENLGMLNGPAVARVGTEVRLYYGSWTNSAVPAGSCAYVNPGALVPGVQVIGAWRASGSSSARESPAELKSNNAGVARRAVDLRSGHQSPRCRRCPRCSRGHRRRRCRRHRCARSRCGPSRRNRRCRPGRLRRLRRLRRPLRLRSR